MEIESAPGRGTRFTLRMPRQSGGPGAAVSAAGSAAATRAEPPPIAPRRVRVLLADDHAVVRAGLRELLAEQPTLQVVGEAADGLEAVAQAEALRPDAIVMDVSMPRMDGVEATRRIRGAWPEIVIFGLSTQEEPEGLHAIEKAGAAGYFTKIDGAERLIGRLVALQDGRPFR
jgi:DNA-binding NarL/FixJ family response regulator